MAIEVIKHGEKAFKATCPVCGCEFIYTAGDLCEDLFKNHFVECPDCNEPVSHVYEQKRCAIDDGVIYDTHKQRQHVQQNMPYTYSVKPLSCEGCIWYNQLSSDKPYIGDSPCNWCPNRQAYCMYETAAVSSTLDKPFIVNVGSITSDK